MILSWSYRIKRNITWCYDCFERTNLTAVVLNHHQSFRHFNQRLPPDWWMWMKTTKKSSWRILDKRSLNRRSSFLRRGSMIINLWRRKLSIRIATSLKFVLNFRKFLRTQIFRKLTSSKGSTLLFRVILHSYLSTFHLRREK